LGGAAPGCRQAGCYYDAFVASHSCAASILFSFFLAAIAAKSQREILCVFVSSWFEAEDLAMSNVDIQ